MPRSPMDIISSTVDGRFNRMPVVKKKNALNEKYVTNAEERSFYVSFNFLRLQSIYTIFFIGDTALFDRDFKSHLS